MATVFDPKAAAVARAQREKAAGRVEIPWRLIGGGALLLVALVLAGLFFTGPRRVWNEWEHVGEQAHYDVIDVVSRGLQSYLASMGAFDPSKSHGTPRATDVMFFRPTWVMSMPDAVKFRGESTQGEFSGKYNPKTREVEAELEFQSFARGAARTTTKVQVTGRVKSGAISFEVNGKPGNF